MKRILFLFTLVLGIVASTVAQRATLMPLVAGDTIVNAGAVNKTFLVTAGYSIVGIQVVVNKISGIVAGTVTPQVSMDGTNYLTLPGATALTLADQAVNTQVWSSSAGGAHFVYYRVRGVGSGTMSAQMRVYYVLRRHD